MRRAEELDHHQPNRDLAFHPLQELTAAPQPTSFIVNVAYFPFAFRHDRSTTLLTAAEVSHNPTEPYSPLIRKCDAQRVL